MPRVEQIEPVLRAMACSLSKQASKLLPLTSNIRYKLATRLLIEDKVENLKVQIPDCKVEYIPRMLNLPPQSNVTDDQQQGYSKLDCSVRSIYEDAIKTVADFNERMKPLRSEFYSQLEYFRPYIRFVVDIVLDNPGYFETLGLYKEEAETLADVFSVLSEEEFSNVFVIANRCSQGNKIVVEDSNFVRLYNHVSNYFKDLARKSKSFDDNQGKTVQKLLEEVKFRPNTTDTGTSKAIKIVVKDGNKPKDDLNNPKK